METTIMGCIEYRIWGVLWESYSNIPKAIFYLLKGEHWALGSPEPLNPSSLATPIP